MTIEHHLPEQLLLAYSAGSLPEAYDLVIASHVSLCDDCRSRLAALDAIGGSVLSNSEAAALSDDAFERTLALIAARDERKLSPAAPPSKPRAYVFPKPLRDYLGGDIDAVNWRAAGGGVRQSVIETGEDATVRLIRIPGGTTVPDHSHGGLELTLVLQGAFADETARFGRGDIQIADETLTHTPVAETGGDCICLAATDAPLRFKGLLPRLAQPFVGI